MEGSDKRGFLSPSLYSRPDSRLPAFFHLARGLIARPDGGSASQEEGHRRKLRREGVFPVRATRHDRVAPSCGIGACDAGAGEQGAAMRGSPPAAVRGTSYGASRSLKNDCSSTGSLSMYASFRKPISS